MEVRAMKLKKYIGVMLGVCTLTLFAGCYEPLEITDSEMDMVAEYAAGDNTVKQLIDITLLQNNMLTGEALNNFVKRSIELMQ